MNKNNKKRITWKNIEHYGIMFLGLLFFAALCYSAFRPASHDTITFNVTGVIPNNINASTLVAIHFQCIQYCVDHVSDYRSLCYEQCSKLGSEGCGK